MLAATGDNDPRDEPGAADADPSVGPQQSGGDRPGSSPQHVPPRAGSSPAPWCHTAAGPERRGVPEEEEPLARRGQRQNGSTRTANGRSSANGRQRRVRDLDNEGIIPVLARAVREVEAGAQRGAVRPAARTKFQVVALLAREERTRVKADAEITEGQRAEQLKRLDGIGTILAKIAARDTTLLSLLAEDADDLRRRPRPQARDDEGRPASRCPRRPSRRPTTIDDQLDGRPGRRAAVGHRPPARQPVPRARLLGRARPRPTRAACPAGSSSARCSSRSSAAASSSCMPLPEPTSLNAPGGHDADEAPGAGRRAAAAEGHRTFLLADEPGLGKTAQALLAAAGRSTPSRCSSSCPTSSRPTGRARRASGRRRTPRPSCTATAPTSTASPTS